LTVAVSIILFVFGKKKIKIWADYQIPCLIIVMVSSVAPGEFWKIALN
jgi:hypothetical protein